MLESHLARLQEKHERLEKELHREMTRPAFDPQRIRAYKLAKLHVKEEISRLQTGEGEQRH